MKLGIDIGSTTIKYVLLGDNNQVLLSSYERHFSQISEKLTQCLTAVQTAFPKETELHIAITGSAGMGIAEHLGVTFVQEVYATKVAMDTLTPGVDVAIELGGEDAKILFLSSGLEVRMNGSCAGGTGAFIDQISTLMGISPTKMNELAQNYEKIYPIASRCGVFAKTDIQPLLNQGARKEDISASIFQAMVNQTVVGLAQGRAIGGNVLYLGGPLTFLDQLRDRFDKVLKVQGQCPDNSLYFVATGAALCSETAFHVAKLKEEAKDAAHTDSFEKLPPLFANQQAYQDFTTRHQEATVDTNFAPDYDGPVYIGVDAGSTTVKTIAIDKNEHILFSRYTSNGGNPIPVIKGFLEEFYTQFPKATVMGSGVTGYGEDMIKNAFAFDHGLVETMAHYRAARAFEPEVDFIIDIGGQDIKCFKIADGTIDDIFLNEACSSGCGSFLQSFATVLGYSMEDFGKLGLFADAPVDLGSRCTVFMNSSIKQAQKDGASVENISAGLSISVVKNAIYKVIRAASAESLGKHIVVQGGTFLNDAVLRAFEREIGTTVTRPNIAGMMGAYGAALYAKDTQTEPSTMLNLAGLQNFTHTAKSTHCKGCTNHCSLTINTFDHGRKFIGGNRCERPLVGSGKASEEHNLYQFKKELLQSYMTSKPGKRGRIGLPMVLNFYELLPFWHTFFETLGFEVVVSGLSEKSTYGDGQSTIPSDTVCYPAKLAHGHIAKLMTQKVDAIFYPCMSYNVDEGTGDNHFNCPVVAYYPEVIKGNVPMEIPFIYDYIGIHRPADFVKKIGPILAPVFGKIPAHDIKKALKLAFAERDSYLQKTRDKAQEIITWARQEDKPILVMAGRPYHLDPEINHGIDKMICAFGVGLITEDSISHLWQGSHKVDVLNQWTYHARLYDSAKYVATQPDMEFVQLVSFGCGVDAVTTDEVRSILQKQKKIYTQIKIDEITNLGAVKIRVRSLLAARLGGKRS